MHWYARFALLLAAPLLLARCSSSAAGTDPLDFTKVTGSTTDNLGNGGLLGPDKETAGSFDERAAFTVNAFRDGDVIRMYYGGGDAAQVTTGCGGINDVHWRIGVATSTDGVNFTRVVGDKAKGSIVENGADGDFDSFLTYRPNVVKDGSTYRMWYNGSTAPFNCPTGTLALNRRIGYAESTDGVHFTKMNTGPGPDGTVLPLGGAGSLDSLQVGYVWVIKDTNDYKMYYSANDANNIWRIGLATSPDARTWTKQPGKQLGGSIVDIGPSSADATGTGVACTTDTDCASLSTTPSCDTISTHVCTARDHFCAYQPSVVKESNNLYRMWYRGCQGPGNPNGPSLGSIMYAESNDGITWVKVNQPGRSKDVVLIAGAAGTFDSGGLTTPSVFLDGNTWNMYYAGFDTTGQYSPGLARAPKQ
jgi:predicted GH43/DUF377 family glycosyl hydrolase